MASCTTWCSATTASEDSLSQLDSWVVEVTDFSLEVKVDILAHVFGAGTDPYLTPPTEYWLALHTSVCTDEAAGTEVTGGDYARQQITLQSSNAGAMWVNKYDLNVPGITAETQIYSASIYSASSGGTFIGYGNLVAPLTITTNRMFHITSGNLRLRFA